MTWPSERSGREPELRNSAAPAIGTHRVALLGNASVGKSSLFERLCEGSSAEAAHPGVVSGSLRPRLAHGLGVPPGCRVCAASCRATPAMPSEATTSPTVTTEILDVPGSSGGFVSGEAERLVRDLLLSRGIHQVVLVLDAKNLRRSLALALEVAEFGIPIILDLNMVDEGEAHGLRIDDAELARAFNAPVNRTIATSGVGVRRLGELLLDARVPSRATRFSTTIEGALRELED
ncbi:FeoB small GTPase domain-containing protein, partial [Myxococcota bacterium]